LRVDKKANFTNNFKKHTEMVRLKKPSMEVINRLDEVLKRLEVLNWNVHEYEVEKLHQENQFLSESYDWSDEIFEVNGKKGLKNVKGEVVIPAIYDDIIDIIFYDETPRPIVAVENGKKGLVLRDGKGTPITKFEFHYISHIMHTYSSYVVSKEEYPEHCAIMVYNKVVTPYEIDKIYEPCDGAIVVEKDGKCGLLSFEMGNVYIKPEYDGLYDNGYGSDWIFTKNGVEGRVTLDGKFVSNEEFETLSDEEQDKLFFICSGSY
jgi:hypothetical protein